MKNLKTKNSIITYKTVEDLQLNETVIKDIDLTKIDIGDVDIDINVDDSLSNTSTNPVQNKVITEALSELSANKLDLSAYAIDNVLSIESENPVQNKVITETINTINTNIDELNTNKLDLSAYVVDSSLNDNSTNPVQNKAIRNEIYNIINRLSYLEYINNIQLSFTTDLEVFATRSNILSGSVSSKEVLINRMFAQTNKWDILKNYLSGTIVTIYNDRDPSQNQDVKIYKALQDVPANTEITETEYWEDLTTKYIEKKPVTELDKNGKEVQVEKYFHKYIEEVPKGTVQTLILKSETKPEEQNVIINWGDDAKTNLRAAINEDNTEGVTCINDEGGYIYTCRHDYARSLVDDNGDQIESKYFIIEIIGNKFSILTSNENENIISNIFGDNMQFYLNCIDIEGLCKGSEKLLYISCADYNSAITSIRNAKSLFENCINLQYAIGFYELTGLNTMLSMERMFAGCINMLNCDCRIAKSIATDENNSGNAAVYLNCENMSSRLRALLPTNGFDSRYVSLSATFKNCKNIYVVDKTNEELGEYNDIDHINNILFKDNSKIFINTSETFSGCNLINSIDGFVPDNWKTA